MRGTAYVEAQNTELCKKAELNTTGKIFSTENIKRTRGERTTSQNFSVFGCNCQMVWCSFQATKWNVFVINKHAGSWWGDCLCWGIMVVCVEYNVDLLSTCFSHEELCEFFIVALAWNIDYSEPCFILQETRVKLVSLCAQRFCLPWLNPTSAPVCIYLQKTVVPGLVWERTDRVTEVRVQAQCHTYA